MSDCPKDYSHENDTHEYGSSASHKLLSSPPKPALRTMGRSTTMVRKMDGQGYARRCEDKANDDQHQSQHVTPQQLQLQLQLQRQHQQHQMVEHHQAPFHQHQPHNSSMLPYPSKPYQSVKPTSETRGKEHLPVNDYHNSHPQHDPYFMQKVVMKLQALKHDKFERCQHEPGQAVLDNHFSNHFRRNGSFKAICIYVEFDAYKKKETDKYVLTVKSNSLGDLKKVLPYKPYSSLRFFYKDEDNMLVEALNDDQLLYSFKDKDGVDKIICEIVVPPLGYYH